MPLLMACYVPQAAKDRKSYLDIPATRRAGLFPPPEARFMV
jgi:hypothetical protein